MRAASGASSPQSGVLAPHAATTSSAAGPAITVGLRLARVIQTNLAPYVSVRRVKRIATGLVLLAWAGTARAQVAPAAPEAVAVGDWKLVPVAEARIRGEYRRDLDTGDRGILVERARLGADAERGPVEMRIVLQDSRLWNLGAGSDALGQPRPLAQIGAYEAWVEAHTSSAHPSFVRVGRQAVTWGEGRLLGASDWSPTGRSIDAARGRLAVGNWAFEALAASLSDPVAPGGSALDPLFAVELYGLARFAQLDPAASLEGSVRGETYTPSLRLHGDAHGWTWGAEGALQLGRAASFVQDRLAWATAGHVAYAFEHVLLSPSVRLGGSYASGDHGGTVYHAFDPMLPDAHRWYGAMDLFGWSNEVEGNARVAIVPWTDAQAAVEYRYARMVEAGGSWRTDNLVTIAPPTASTDLELGHEIDATLRWSPWVPLELSAGYSVLVLGAAAKSVLASERVRGSDLAHMAMGQATVKLP